MVLEQLHIHIKKHQKTKNKKKLWTQTLPFSKIQLKMDHRPKCKLQTDKISRRNHKNIYMILVLMMTYQILKYKT